MKLYGMCVSGKIAYLDELDALLNLSDLSVLRDGYPKTEANVYRCESCDLFHLTSGPVEE